MFEVNIEDRSLSSIFQFLIWLLLTLFILVLISIIFLLQCESDNLKLALLFSLIWNDTMVCTSLHFDAMWNDHHSFYFFCCRVIWNLVVFQYHHQDIIHLMSQVHWVCSSRRPLRFWIWYTYNFLEELFLRKSTRPPLFLVLPGSSRLRTFLPFRLRLALGRYNCNCFKPTCNCNVSTFSAFADSLISMKSS